MLNTSTIYQDDPETCLLDGFAENIRRLKALFLELVTEGPNGATVNDEKRPRPVSQAGLEGVVKMS